MADDPAKDGKTKRTAAPIEVPRDGDGYLVFRCACSRLQGVGYTGPDRCVCGRWNDVTEKPPEA